MFARQLANAVGRDGGAVCKRLVVQARQRIDQVEVVTLDGFNAVVGVVPVGHLLGERRFVEGRVVECDGAGIDGLLRQTGHHRHNRAAVDSTGQKSTQRHFGDHAQSHRFAQAMHQLGLCVRLAYLVVQRKANIPILHRLPDGFAPADR